MRRRGGRRSPPPRGPRRRFPLMLMILLLFVAAGAVAYLVTKQRSDSGGPPAAAIRQPSVPAKKDSRPPRKPSPHAPPPGISLIGAKPIRLRFHSPPRAGLVFDLASGQVLWAHRPLRKLPIASLTKIMTAIIVVERTRPGERARVTHEALNYTGSGVGVLPRKKLVPVEGLLAGMLLPSGNDAALALADHVAGHDRNFVKLMNARARAMGLGCTHYSSSYGLPDTNHSCAADLAALARVAMAKPRIARLVRKPQAKVRFPIKTGYLYVNSTNPLLHLRYPGTIGLKTGSTDKAGHCFVGVVRRGRRTFGVVLLHSPNPGGQATKLMNAAFKLRP
jgi:D-alanyl-D-alanine carboxypeptidase (penicillin-binding protein 5/6)